MRISPGVVPRLEFFIVDYAGNPVTGLTRTDFSAFAYCLITEGLYAAPVTVTPSSNVASTAAKSAGQFVTINSAKGHYAVDCPSGAANSAATHVEISATPNTGTHIVYPVRSEIETKISTLFESVSGANVPTVERSPTDAKVITFAWPVSGATITATVSKDNASYVATSGTVSFLRTEGGRHFYTLSYNAADRPTTEGTARYKFTDGVYTRYVNIRIAVVGGAEAVVSQDSLNSIIAGVQSVHVGISDAVESSGLTIVRGDTWVQSITDLGSLTGKKLTFALKTSARDTDANAVIFIDEDTGLTKIKGVTAPDASLGSITIDDANAGDITIRLESSVTLQLATGQYHDALKAIKDNADFTLRNNGVTTVILGVIQEVS